MAENNGNISLDGSDVNIDANNNAEAVDEFEYVLFLLLVLLIIGNGRSFDKHFELLNSQTKKINTMLEALSVTAEGLNGALQAPQNVLNELQ